MREGTAHNKTSFATVLIVVLLLALSIVSPAMAQGEVSADRQHSLLGVGDWVSIQIAGQSDATSYVAVDNTINVPLVGNIPVGGVSPEEAAKRIAKALKDGGYFIDPHVTVVFTQSQSQSVSVVGQVQLQGRYPITPRTTIVDLLAQAGGLKETASDVGYIVRRDDTGRVTRYPVNLSVLGDGNDAPTWNLLAGDSLVVPPAEHFAVQGEVTTPGRYRIEPGMTVMQAVARAGGITERGSERRITVQRVDKPGHYQNIHAKPGDLVKPDDIIRVKESIF